MPQDVLKKREGWALGCDEFLAECEVYNFTPLPSLFYRTQARSLPCLVTHSVRQSLALLNFVQIVGFV